jgi:acyl-CoA thioesterase YciA
MELVTTYLCKTSDIGVHSNVFGGRLISIIDESSAAYAAQICDTPRIVTIKISELLFEKAIKVNNIIKVYAKVLKFGNTSITLYVEVRKHNVYTGHQEMAMKTEIKFVRIDDEGKPIPIPNYVKERYNDRVKTFGKGLLSIEEREIEEKTIKKSFNEQNN